MGHDWGGRPTSGFSGHTIATAAGPLPVWQFVAYRHESGSWEVSAAVVDLSPFDELGTEGASALLVGLEEAAAVVERADREALALSEGSTTP